MKFCLLIPCTLLAILTAQGQVQFNVFAGPQLTTSSYTVEQVKQETSYKTGFHLGMGMKVPIESKLYFAPAIFYSLKGYKTEFDRFVYPPSVLALDNNTTFHNVETAFLLQLNFSNPGLYLKGGPSLDFQLFGKEKFNTDNGTVDRNIPFGFDTYGHFSANMLLQLGYELKSGYFLSCQYTHGLANINNADFGPTIRHRAFGLSLGKVICSRK